MRPACSSLPMAALVGFTLPLSEPRVSGCEWDFVHCSFSVAERIPTDFIIRCYVCAFSQLWFSGLGSPVWDWEFILLSVLQLRYPSWISGVAYGNRASPLSVSILSTSLNVTFSVNLCLVLGGGECSIHLLCRHLLSFCFTFEGHFCRVQNSRLVVVTPNTLYISFHSLVWMISEENWR